MASTFLTLLDDIATLLDDVAVMTKAATKKTIGVVREDAVITASKTSDLHPRRQIAVIVEIAKRSLVNKAMVIPGVLAVSALTPMLVTPLLLACAGYICFEGFHKVVKKARGDKADHSLAKNLSEARSDEELIRLEREKIKGAVRTDLILSGEIAILSLASAAHLSLPAQAAFLAMVGVGVTVAVYTTVAAILAVDGLAVNLARCEHKNAAGDAKRKLGDILLKAAPLVMKSISFLGMGAMFYLGGSILLGAFPAAQAAVGAFATGPVTQTLAMFGASVLTGAAVGVIGNGIVGALKMTGILALGRETKDAVKLGTAIISGRYDRDLAALKAKAAIVPDVKKAANAAAAGIEETPPAPQVEVNQASAPKPAP